MTGAENAIRGHDWWHTIEVAPGVVTPGWWDLRATAGRMPWPGPLDGLRCLDVGTMDGFWAFEMESRGAAEVVACDLGDPARREGTFSVAAGLRGSRARYLERAVHDLDPDRDGEFDLVFVGYVLQMVSDPIGALVAMRRVCRGWVIVLDTVSAPLSLLPAPLARLSARRSGAEWFVFNRRGLRRAVALAGFEVEAVTGILRDRPGPAVARDKLPAVRRASHALGLLGRSAAVRGRARAPRPPGGQAAHIAS